MTAGEQLIHRGEVTGQRKLLLAQLRARFPDEVSPEVESRVMNAREAQIQAWGVRVLTAQTLPEVLAE